MEEYKIEIDYSMLDSGGYTRLKATRESAFVNTVNRKLGDYWVRTGQQINIQDAMFEVLAEKYDELQKQSN